MKKLLIGLLVLVVIVVAAAVILPFVIPIETIREQVIVRAKEATGRDLAIDGDFSLSLLPRLELQATDVRFANAPGQEPADMVRLKELGIELEVLPLLSGNVKLGRFVLVEPDIHLAVDKAGKPNWAFGTPGEAPAAESGAGGVGGPSEISLGEVRIVDGRVIYDDQSTGQKVVLEQINFDVALTGLDSPFKASGSLVQNGEKLELAIDSPTIRPILENGTSEIVMNLKSAVVTAGYAGTVTVGKAPRVTGDVDLEIPSLTALAAWAGQPLEADFATPLAFAVKGALDATGQKVSFNEATIAFDDIKGTGDLAVALGGARPALSGRLDLGLVDVNPYLPKEKADAAGSGGQGSGTTSGSGGKAAAAGWSDEPMDFSGLGAADVDFKLSVEGLHVQELKIGRSALAMTLKNAVLGVDLSELNLYGGKGQGKIGLDASKAVPALSEQFVLEGIQAQPLLTDAAGFEKLEGTGRIEVAVTASGKSQRAMVESLNGKGAIKFENGSINGINLAAMVRNVTTAFSGGGGEQKTDFAELSGTFTITDGQLENKDMVLLNPLIRVNGAGTSDLPARTVNYRVTPKVVASLEGQGGATDKKGLAVPVIIEGPWDNLSYRPDMEGVVKDLVKDPGAAVDSVKDTLKGVKEGGAAGALGKVLQGGDGGAATSGSGEAPAKPDVKKTLKNLLGN
ncbi:AsmA family protein [Oceanibacterium hippocampi]|uniref:Putative assembly protein n=1 Tax=Oceanibacterium hippocampi TaxID=745714 RepID=A0A1Y5TGJ3_9PROT|nr:AsmA family protein [Oceanibacterium hippocampi]SLN59903.1 putative assembly protein [Oceanibacterium hippocampi]